MSPEDWASNVIHQGLGTCERLLNKPEYRDMGIVTAHSGGYLVDNKLTIADCVLMPQVYNALRYKVDLTLYPTVLAVYKRLIELE